MCDGALGRWPVDGRQYSWNAAWWDASHILMDHVRAASTPELLAELALGKVEGCLMCVSSNSSWWRYWLDAVSRFVDTTHYQITDALLHSCLNDDRPRAHGASADSIAAFARSPVKLWCTMHGQVSDATTLHMHHARSRSCCAPRVRSLLDGAGNGAELDRHDPRNSSNGPNRNSGKLFTNLGHLSLSTTFWAPFRATISGTSSADHFLQLQKQSNNARNQKPRTNMRTCVRREFSNTAVELFTCSFS